MISGENRQLWASFNKAISIDLESLSLVWSFQNWSWKLILDKNSLSFGTGKERNLKLERAQNETVFDEFFGTSGHYSLKQTSEKKPKQCLIILLSFWSFQNCPWFKLSKRSVMYSTNLNKTRRLWKMCLKLLCLCSAVWESITRFPNNCIPIMAYTKNNMPISMQT